MQQKIVRLQEPVIALNKEKLFEIRQDNRYYGISHYTQFSAKSEKSVINELRGMLKESYNRRSNFVVLKVIAQGHAETEIKNKDKLPIFLFAVFYYRKYEYNGNEQIPPHYEYFGCVGGVDYADAKSKIGDICYSYKRSELILKKLKNKKLVRNYFLNEKIEDKTLEEKQEIITTYRLLYDDIKGEVKEKFEEEKIDETSLY